MVTYGSGCQSVLKWMKTIGILVLMRNGAEAERRGLPTELALLPIIESSYDPAATSSAAAAGMWQFIPSTGKIYGLRQTSLYDGRRDVVESTRAAYEFLGSLYNQFGSWELALAAYNAGPGRIQQAINRNQAAGLPTDYWSLRLPQETMNYVPRFLAVAQIIKSPSKYGRFMGKQYCANHSYTDFNAYSGHLDSDSIDYSNAPRIPVAVTNAANVKPVAAEPPISAREKAQILAAVKAEGEKETVKQVLEPQATQAEKEEVVKEIKAIAPQGTEVLDPYDGLADTTPANSEEAKLNQDKNFKKTETEVVKLKLTGTPETSSKEKAQARNESKSEGSSKDIHVVKSGETLASALDIGQRLKLDGELPSKSTLSKEKEDLKATAKATAKASSKNTESYAVKSAQAMPYANSNAPKGGYISTASIGTFDNLNSMNGKGSSTEGINYLFDSLMDSSLDEPDFQMTAIDMPQSLTPGAEQAQMWGSKAADEVGNYNYAGVKSPVVDQLIQQIIYAPNREQLVLRTRALDRACWVLKPCNNVIIR
ncbi:unnamed protein product [Oppiella nova]|uniref:Transglycosylase SLT domain-containing protein n=1 Tax=Oppiella nova TaxID=334625 RepID=A0A7R9L8N1_9ACAR|nr:unnamed protein product [Oppiella nova]CAG2159479.1 unnamed protein product [Oppiella nova]